MRAVHRAILLSVIEEPDRSSPRVIVDFRWSDQDSESVVLEFPTHAGTVGHRIPCDLLRRGMRGPAEFCDVSLMPDLDSAHKLELVFDRDSCTVGFRLYREDIAAFLSDVMIPNPRQAEPARDATR
jgi:hypothetical protein